MGLTFDFSNDPINIWDNTDAIVYSSTRRGTPVKWPVATALRQTMTLRETGTDSAGVMTSANVKWFIPAKLLGRPAPAGIVPKPGDIIALQIELEQRTWVVMDTIYEPFDQVYELNCLDLGISLDLADYINVMTPLNLQDAALGRRSLMVPKYVGLACRIQEVSSTTVNEQGRRSRKKSYLIFLPDAQIEIGEEEQIIDLATGDIYDVTGFTDSNNLTTPMVIQAERTP